MSTPKFVKFVNSWLKFAPNKTALSVRDKGKNKAHLCNIKTLTGFQTHELKRARTFQNTMLKNYLTRLALFLFLKHKLDKH